MNRNEAGFGIEIQSEGFAPGPALIALREIAESENCVVMHDGLPEIRSRGRIVPRALPACFFPKEGKMCAFLISKDVQQFDPSLLPTNEFTMQELIECSQRSAK